MNLKKFFIVSLLMFAASPAWALQVCKCSEREQTVIEKFDQSYAVFIGETEEVVLEYNPDRVRVVFNVINSWKGIRNEKVTIYTDSNDAYSTMRNGISCGYGFVKNQKYLIFSDRKKNAKGPSWVSACGDVIPLDNAGSELEYLNGLPPLELRERR